MLRAATSLAVRSLLAMAIGALIVITAERLAPDLVPRLLPAVPPPPDTAATSPDQIAKGLNDIRGALE